MLTPDLSTSTASAAIFLPDRLRLDEARASLAAASDALDETPEAAAKRMTAEQLRERITALRAAGIFTTA